MAIIKMKNTELTLNILTTDTMIKIDQNCRKVTACRILGDKRANVFVSNTDSQITVEPTMLVITAKNCW